MSAADSGARAIAQGGAIGDAELAGVLHEVVETLAPLDRTPCSEGERQAGEWLLERLRAVEGCEAAAEPEPSWGIFAPTATCLGLAGLLAGALVLSGRRRAGGLLAAATFAGITDEAQNGPRVLRRLVRRRRSTLNVIGRVGEPPPGEAGRRPGESRPTLVVIAHHDAPQTGVIFDQSLQRRVHELAPQLLARFKTSPPQWWVGLAGPALSLAGAVTRRRGPVLSALALGALGSALAADIWRNETVPGANDNLSGVAVLVALAHLLQAEPAPGLRVLLVSCGAEETLQDGIRAFVARHAGELPRGRTCFLNLDTVGSPHLVMLEGEGPVWMEIYKGPWWRDLVAECARRAGVELERGFRARASTDSVIPSRAGYPTATIVSINEWRCAANYHLPTDTPENLDYDSVLAATRLAHTLARELAGGAGQLA